MNDCIGRKLTHCFRRKHGDFTTVRAADDFVLGQKSIHTLNEIVEAASVALAFVQFADGGEAGNVFVLNNPNGFGR